MVADLALSVAGYERVILVPANVPAHKGVAGDVSARHRLRMARLAVRGRPGLICDSCEIDRGGVSYTIETVAFLKEKYRIDARPGLLIGDDLLDGFESWRRAAELADVADLLVFHRTTAARLDFPYPHTYLENSPVTVSSTEIRERIRRGEPIEHLVPCAVGRYIATHRLYRD